ncbi:PREDICTED: transcription factor LHW-like isoform X1 [Lupinus angustifolius]|nr:PREDICTED: transcription factor LHW-like isoform X1 [Lupinus angustifolius]
MGFLLKEALKTLCARNQWSYAVFWKIGCNNPKLLIWEDCFYEDLPSLLPPRTVGISNLPYQDGEVCWFSSESQLGIEEGKVGSLINKMMVNNSVNIIGQGIIGRAAFTGNHMWILLNNFNRDACLQEVYTELHYQFSAGIQTLAVIPVLPHGVVQLGSFLPIMENMGFVNDMKSLILQLASIPGALLSEDYSAKLTSERLSGPMTDGVPVTVDLPVITSNCTLSLPNGSNQPSNSSHASSRSISQPFNNYQGSVLTPQMQNLNQVSPKYGNLCHPMTHSMNRAIVSAQQENRVVEARAEVIPSNLDLYMQQHSAAYNTRYPFNELAAFGQSNFSDGSLKYMEQQIFSSIGGQGQVNPIMNPSSTSNISQLKRDGGHILQQSQSCVNNSVLGGIPIHNRMSNLLRTNLFNSSVSNSPKVSDTNFYGIQKVGERLHNDNSTKAGTYSLPNLANQSVASHMHLHGSHQKTLPLDLKHDHEAFVSTDQGIDSDLLQALKIPSLHLEEHASMSDHIQGFVHDHLNKDGSSQHMMKMNAKREEASAQLPSGDDLFDVLGVDFKRKLLNGNWDELLADESDANAENLDKKAAGMNMQAIGSGDSYSVSEAISDSGIFSGTDTGHLLDAVVSRAQSATKQNSDDMSCRTTVTRISTTSVPSPISKQVMSDNVVKGKLIDFPRMGDKIGAVETSSFKSGCIEDDAGNCPQTTSIYGSELSSWVEKVSNAKHENSVSTGYSKRPDEGCKSNRKRLKPGENPRPRPKDRQMIQDRVKELREIVPNGAKCSIDALLERTIKHMLFLQSVTKHADKLKHTGESKIVSKEGGLLLKDNFEGGATWAYEVGSQSMVCPIIVEDLNPPGQMLVEMLCEERGFFLEIADLIRGLGLTILKGVMEARNDKIWARFVVEANRDVTRMEIFMSLVRLLEQTAKGIASSSNAFDNNMTMYHSFPQATQI